ncbi:MAG TPA: ATP-binding cassette domain-containing protein [Methanoregulaceae archaeon]|nr:ATP-binding cassette domain-containing protein [Methanoregulaceae archaeon]
MEPIRIETITILPGTAKDGRPEPFDELVIRAGDTISIVGPTGSGKSALINDIEVFARQDTVTGRTVLVNGEAPPELICRDPANKPIAMIAQTSKCLADLRVRQFLAMHCAARGLDAGRTVDETIALANEFTGEAVGEEMRMTGLSGGQTRALMIADALLVSNTPIILLDEIENAGIFKNRVMARLREFDRAVLFVTHDPFVALLSDRRIVMRNGAVVDVLEPGDAEADALGAVAAMDGLLHEIRERLRAGELLTGGL